MKSWLMSVTAASLLCALAMTLCPKGRVRAVTGFVCAMVCMLALVSPLMELDAAELSSSMAYWRQKAETLTASAEEAAQTEQRLFIQRECEAYILDEAEALGLDVPEAEVRAVWDEEKKIWYPQSARIAAAYDPALATAVEAGLGITKEEQTWEN